MSIQDNLSRQRKRFKHDPEALALLVNYEVRAAAHRKTSDYRQGYEDGARDAQVITQPIKTGGHTEEAYTRIRSQYEAAIHTFAPTAWQLGYGEGFDAKVLELRPETAEGDDAG